MPRRKQQQQQQQKQQQQRLQNQSLKGEYRLKRKTLQRLRDPLHLRDAQRASRQAAQCLMARHAISNAPLSNTTGKGLKSIWVRRKRPSPSYDPIVGTLVVPFSLGRPGTGPLPTFRTSGGGARGAAETANGHGRGGADFPWWLRNSPTPAPAAKTTTTTTALTKHCRTWKQNGNDDTDAIWMCGVCGMVFASCHSADVHEQQHIATVVAGMEWNTSTAQSPFQTTANTKKNTIPNHPFATTTSQPTRTQLSSSLDNWNGTVLNNAVDIDENDNDNNDDDDDSIFQDRPQSPPDASLGGEDALLLSQDYKLHGVLADEALVDVLSRAVPLILTEMERDAERELQLLARDKAHYDEVSKRAVARRTNPSNRFRSDGEDLMAKVQNKFLDAYQIMKESDGQKGMTDQYQRHNRSTMDRDGRGVASTVQLGHSTRTVYVNVMVKNSVQVVRHELERLAKQRWDVMSQQPANAATTGSASTAVRTPLTRFEQFRVYTQQNVVKLAGIALASDFTPRRIAVQLSNDLYRLMTPRMKRRGVTIETEIEYRVGPYFVLAVNVISIDWKKLVRATYRDAAQRKAKWNNKQDQPQHSRNSSDAGGKDESDGVGARVKTDITLYRQSLDSIRGLLNMTLFEVIERSMVLLYNLPRVVYLPVCWVAYYLLFGSSIRQFILSSVADEIFYYVEEKGMAMDIHVCRAEAQAAFMLAALREIRAGGQELKQKRQSQQSGDGASNLDGRNILGPLMGPLIAVDQGPAPSPPEGFAMPENLEFVGLELDLPVGFHRLRWSFLSKRSDFVTEALYKTEAKYENIVMGDWNKFADYIGESKLPDTINLSDFIGAEKEGEYMMPKSAFVSANMCFETHYLLAYNEFCFCLKKRAKNPDAPFGKTFIAWTQYLVVNTGNNTCRLTCSVQPEFPNGEPMVSRQIRGGMRAGTGEVFVLLGETVAKYADAFS